MKTFVIVMFCLFILGAITRVLSLNKGTYPRVVRKDTDVFALFIEMVFIVWAGLVLFY